MVFWNNCRIHLRGGRNDGLDRAISGRLFTLYKPVFSIKMPRNLLPVPGKYAERMSGQKGIIVPEITDVDQFPDHRIVPFVKKWSFSSWILCSSFTILSESNFLRCCSFNGSFFYVVEGDERLEILDLLVAKPEIAGQ